MKAINPITNEMIQRTSRTVLTFGLTFDETQKLHAYIPQKFKVLSCDHDFKMLLTTPCHCIVVNPHCLTKEQQEVFSLMFENEEAIIILFTEKTRKSFGL